MWFSQNSAWAKARAKHIHCTCVGCTSHKQAVSWKTPWRHNQTRAGQAMASGETPCEPWRSSSGRTEERRIFGNLDYWNRRCFDYKPIRVLHTLCDASSGVWEITVDTGGDNDGKRKRPPRGTCFLGKFKDDYEQTVFGLFTASHVLSEANIRNAGTKVTITYSDPKAHSPSTCQVNIQDSPFYFTCPLLDVTFLEFDENMRERLRKGGFKFLDVYEKRPGSAGAEFHVLHYSGKRNDHDQYYSTGYLEQYNGLHLFHSASTDDGASGAPVFHHDGCHVVAIHTAKSVDAANNYNVAVVAASVLEVLIPRRDPKQSIHERHYPTMNELRSLERPLKGLGLQMQRARTRDESHPPRIPYYFTHPGLKVSDVEDTVEIHFVLTGHGWYWSELSPDNGTQEPSWAPATTHVFGYGSHYKGKTVEDEHDGFSFDRLQSVEIGSLKTDSELMDIGSNKEEENYSFS